ncbi:Acg family FMN-binding oxidoreductase [Spirosoma arcticum]
MNRQQFLGIAGGTVILAGGAYYGFSDRRNYTRADSEQLGYTSVTLTADERQILLLASLAPSGHNTQPWFVKHLEPYHWIVGNDKTRWLPGVDPNQRETILSIGAFLQNIEYAASNLGYTCQFDTMAMSNQDEDIVTVKLRRSSKVPSYDTQKITRRRTVRSNYLDDALKKEDLTYLINGESEFIQFIPNTGKECRLLNEQTIEANRIQSYRDVAQQELADWIRFSSKDAAAYRDGLTTASMEIDGILGWLLRNFYGESAVMKPGFRNQAIDKVKQQVAQSAGWLLITSKDNAVTTLLETGKRMQRLFLIVRDRGVALHPMTQILEESPTNQTINQSIGISGPVQFILRTGYLKTYPEPVSLRRSVDGFVHT